MHISLAGETLFYIGSFAVTNSILTSWFVTAFLMCIGIIIGRSFKKVPSTLQQIVEMAYETIEGLAVSISGEAGKKHTPLALTLFLFILLNNWLGLIPGVGSIGYYHTEHGEKVLTPFVRSGSADLNTTLALALIAVVIAHVLGVRSSGPIGHLKHFRNPLEIVSEFSKVLSFSFRLFGNVFAGEVLLAVAAGIVAIVIGRESAWFGIPGGLIMIPFMGLELLVGFIQAFIFAALTLVFIGVFTRHSEEHAESEVRVDE